MTGSPATQSRRADGRQRQETYVNLNKIELAENKKKQETEAENKKKQETENPKKKEKVRPGTKLIVPPPTLPSVLAFELPSPRSRRTPAKNKSIPHRKERKNIKESLRNQAQELWPRIYRVFGFASSRLQKMKPLGWCW
jgi:hypothetical protein